MGRMLIGRDTILDLESVEYKWIEALSHDGVKHEEINASIQRCLGGDDESADLLRRVAMRQCPPNMLIEHLDAMEKGVAMKGER
ncbi:hypothetical protein [Photobacterium sp. TY1-4]|uniref:hypothetical protein n=1 Tax=Photobacterium sp. TY1-4 TaxID=2899122 RepID=UPI0021C0047B|nr:hypothetical protein [Photobacterium sp. TY1-4]UXI03455.1 hypothetical protein NH461_23825 [Photobacterium sp. TY1-4]